MYHIISIALALVACAPTTTGTAARMNHPPPMDDTGFYEQDDTAQADDTSADDTATDDTAGPVDLDGDGWTDADDCNDADANINPDALETCDGKDNDCDGETDEDLKSEMYRDSDGDGYGDPGVTLYACGTIGGYVDDDTDCDDDDSTAHPGAVEGVFDGIDNDCNGAIDECGTDEHLYWNGVTEASVRDGYTAQMGRLSGTGTICAWDCGAFATAIASTTSICTEPVPMPSTIVDGTPITLCVTPWSKGDADCDVVTSEGRFTIHVWGY